MEYMGNGEIGTPEVEEVETTGILSKIGSFFKKTAGVVHSVLKGAVYFVTGAVVSTVVAIPIIIGLPFLIGGAFWKLIRRKSREDLGNKMEEIFKEIFDTDIPEEDLSAL